MNVREIMAIKLRAARSSKGLTAAQVGEAVGKSAKTIYFGKRGKANRMRTCSSNYAGFTMCMFPTFLTNKSLRTLGKSGWKSPCTDR